MGASAVRGVRWVLWLNAVTLPMSFVTNLVLGRTSIELFGLYSAIQIFVGAFQTFFIFGGNAVFTRFVPALPPARRIAFLASYSAIVLGIFSAVWTTFLVAAPNTLHGVLARFGSPPPILAYGTATAVVVWAFASHFLYGIERAPRAAVALKLVVVGHFVVALAVLSPFRATILGNPSLSLWIATTGTYGVAALAAALFIRGSGEAWAARRLSWFLPRGFWSVVVYTHLGTVVEFVYSSLSPSVVLLWLDIGALGRLTAALRWVGIVALLPGMVVSVVAPGLARLEASGLRADALRHARSAVRASDLAVVPAVFALMLFAPAFMGIFGPEYREQATLLRFAALSALAGPAVYLGTGVAVALGALRAYLAVSVLYVVSSVVLAVVLVPVFGLPGAAAATAASSGAQCIVVTLVTRRLGFRLPRTTALGWAFGGAVLAVSWAAEPVWWAAAAAWVGFTGAFAWSAGVTAEEVRVLAGRMTGAHP